MARGSPNRVDEQAVAGVPVRFEYYHRRRDVLTIPDEAALAAADCYDVLKLWTVIAGWAVRFIEVNPTWTVNGSKAVEAIDSD